MFQLVCESSRLVYVSGGRRGGRKEGRKGGRGGEREEGREGRGRKGGEVRMDRKKGE